MKFNEWYMNFLKEDKTGLSDREMLFMAFTAGEGHGKEIINLIDEMIENRRNRAVSAAKINANLQVIDMLGHEIAALTELKNKLMEDEK